MLDSPAISTTLDIFLLAAMHQIDLSEGAYEEWKALQPRT